MATTQESENDYDISHPWITIVDDARPYGNNELKATDLVEPDNLCTWTDIEELLNDCYGKSRETYRYCILGKKNTTYVQTAFHRQAGADFWRVEWRVTRDDGTYHHYYGTQKNPVSRRIGLVDNLKTVMRAFHYFYTTDGTQLPTDELEWYELDLNWGKE